MCSVWQLHFRRAMAIAPHRKIVRQSDAPWAREVALKDDPWGARHGPAGYRHITWSVSDNPGPMCGPPAVRILHGRFDDFPRTGTRAGAAPPPPSTTMALGEKNAGRILRVSRTLFFEYRSYKWVRSIRRVPPDRSHLVLAQTDKNKCSTRKIRVDIPKEYILYTFTRS